MSNPVFVHYMVGGMTQAEAVTDVTQAKAMGFDAFALNVISTDTWSTAAIGYLFQAAAAIGFHLFFSFDMLHFTSPSQFFPLLQQYASSSAYYKYNSLPFVSTFYGGTLTFGASSPQIGWNENYKQALAASGIKTYFVPCFSDSSVAPSSLYDTFPVADGLFSWDTAWPYVGDGKVNVSSSVDQQLQTAAKAAKKAYMMPWSSLQFKHLDGSQNWVRRGELNIAQRIPQILSVKPDFVEFLTWNDGGESTYIGNVWPEAITGSPAHAYIDNFNHSGWGQLITPFITAYKAGKSNVGDIVPLNGAKAAGVFWYRTILTTATCASDSIGKPSGWNNAEDVVNVAIMLSSAGSTVNVYSGGSKIGSMVGVKGLNAWSISGLRVGAVKVEVLPSSGGSALLSKSGTVNVAADAAICNYNYQVVGLN